MSEKVTQPLHTKIMQPLQKKIMQPFHKKNLATFLQLKSQPPPKNHVTSKKITQLIQNKKLQPPQKKSCHLSTKKSDILHKKITQPFGIQSCLVTTVTIAVQRTGSPIGDLSCNYTSFAKLVAFKSSFCIQSRLKKKIGFRTCMRL